MAKRIFLFFYLGLLGFLLSSPTPPVTQTRSFVAEVDVYCRLDGKPLHMHLTGQRQIADILGCVRAAQSHIPAPELPAGSPDNSCLIRVRLTDGKALFYRQIGTEHFCKNSDNWKHIDPRQGKQLFVLLRTLKTQGFQGAVLFCENIFPLFACMGIFLTNVPRNTPRLLYEMELFI